MERRGRMRTESAGEDQIPMVESHDQEDEETEYNAIDAEDEDGDTYYDDEDAEQDWEGTDVDHSSAGMHPRHWMRYLRTQSTKGMGGMKFQRTMARFMSEVFRATHRAAYSNDN